MTGTSPQPSDDGHGGPPLVSIVVPVYNHQHYVGATLDSLIAQTYPRLELIAIDDGSPDQSLHVLKAYQAKCEHRFERFLLIDQPNAGVSTTLNRGIEAALGPFIFLIASDDWAEPDAISSLVSVMSADPEIGFACGDSDFIDADGAPLVQERNGKQYASMVRLHLAHRADVEMPVDFGTYKSLINGNYIPGGDLLRRSMVLKVGGYDPDCVIEDFDLWLKLSKICRFEFVDRVLCHYRVHGGSVMHTMPDRMLFDAVRVMLREGPYAVEQGLAVQWREHAERMMRDYGNIVQAKLDRAQQEISRLRDALQAAERARAADVAHSKVPWKLRQLAGPLRVIARWLGNKTNR